MDAFRGTCCVFFFFILLDTEEDAADRFGFGGAVTPSPNSNSPNFFEK